MYEYVQSACDVLVPLDLPKTRDATGHPPSRLNLGDVTMDVPATAQPTAAKLPWVPPVIKQVPIVSHTNNGVSRRPTDGGMFIDDFFGS